jgi:site-specific DNA recombinase
MKAAIYLRVSTEHQAEKETPIGAQKEECLRWAKENGYSVSKTWIVEDRGFSGAEEGRPGLQKLLAAARKNPPFQALIAPDNTRFSRSEELFYWLRREFRTAGVEMLSATEHGEIELLTGVKAIIGAEQRRQIAKRTALAMRHIAKQGLRCGGMAPYGYKRKELPVTSGNKPVTLVPNSETAPVLRRLFRMRANGASLREMAHKLNAEGIPGPSSKGWRGRAIIDILKNPVYRGCAVYGRSKKVGRNPSRSVKIPREKWLVIEDAHKALIDKQTWEIVQTSFQEGSPTRKTTFVCHPLSGLIYCGKCGEK